MEAGHGSDLEREEDESVSELLRDRFRLSAISIAEAEAKQIGMDISEPIVACIADLAFKYTEQLAKDLDLFAQHAGRKTVTMDDVILSAHRNEHVAASLRSFSNDLKAKEPQSERKRKKMSKKEDKATTSAVHIHDLEQCYTFYSSFYPSVSGQDRCVNNWINAFKCQLAKDCKYRPPLQ